MKNIKLWSSFALLSVIITVNISLVSSEVNRSSLNLATLMHSAFASSGEMGEICPDCGCVIEWYSCQICTQWDGVYGWTSVPCMIDGCDARIDICGHLGSGCDPSAQEMCKDYCPDLY